MILPDARHFIKQKTLLRFSKETSFDIPSTTFKEETMDINT